MILFSIKFVIIQCIVYIILFHIILLHLQHVNCVIFVVLRGLINFQHILS